MYEFPNDFAPRGSLGAGQRPMWNPSSFRHEGSPKIQTDYIERLCYFASHIGVAFSAFIRPIELTVSLTLNPRLQTSLFNWWRRDQYQPRVVSFYGMMRQQLHHITFVLFKGNMLSILCFWKASVVGPKKYELLLLSVHSSTSESAYHESNIGPI